MTRENVYLEDVHGPYEGQVRPYSQVAAQNAIAAGSAKYPDPDGSEEVTVTPIPEEFPGRDALEAAEVTTIEGVPRHPDDLVAIPGIGKGTAAKILEALG